MLKTLSCLSLVVLIAALGLAPIATAEPADTRAPVMRDRNTARQAVGLLRAAYETAVEAGDAAAVAALYTEDAVLMPAMGGRFEGREEIQGSYQATFDQGEIEFSAEPRSFEIDTEFAVEDGAVTFSLAPEGGERQVVHVDYLVIAKVVDGELKIFRMMSKPRTPVP